jgi:hypothetical protein
MNAFTSSLALCSWSDRSTPQKSPLLSPKISTPACSSFGASCRIYAIRNCAFFDPRCKVSQMVDCVERNLHRQHHFFALRSAFVQHGQTIIMRQRVTEKLLEASPKKRRWRTNRVLASRATPACHSPPTRDAAPTTRPRGDTRTPVFRRRPGRSPDRASDPHD